MKYNETCPSCGKAVTITTAESSYKADGNSKSYVIICGDCNAAIRTITSGIEPIVNGGYIESDP